MPPKKDLSIRLSAELRDALDRAAAQSGETITAIVERALAAHLGIMQGPTLADRVRVLEIAVANLQRNAGQRPTLSPDNAMQRPTPATVASAGQYRANPQNRPSQDGQEGASNPIQVSQHPRHDGQRWLSTGQAIEVSKARGGPDNRATLNRWAKDGKLATMGLRYCPHGTKDNGLASFEDLRWGKE